MEILKIPWIEWYWATADWKIWSYKTCKFLKPFDNTHWYYIVNLSFYLNWMFFQKVQKVHRLILKTFKWESKLLANHKNWNKKDNRIENLEYVTYSENLKHAYDTWLRKSIKWLRWEKCSISKLTDKQMSKLMDRILHWEYLKEVAEEHGMSKGHISKMFKLTFWFWNSRKTTVGRRKEQNLRNFSNPV